MKNAERRRAPLLAKLGEVNRPLRVRPVRYMSREWWAVDAADTWAGMVMDLRRLGYEAVAVEDEVLVREASAMYEPELEGPLASGGFKPFPTIVPTINVRRESYLSSNAFSDEYEDYDSHYDDVDDEEEAEDSGDEAYSTKYSDEPESLD
jgi:hypothetical protein